ncbi:hypothetical protein [Streptomyces violens]|uniref:hypothetical protein n=1 Tax=Streptomyces violens TaxID=66377 RepID=UPI0012FF06CD|nr:hypothetical protein [Streptomyces violens]
MKRAVRSFALGAAVVATTLAGMPAAEAQTTSAAAMGQITCKVNPNRPHESHGKPGWIVGKSQYWCTAGIDSLVNTVKLQKKVKGKWVTAAKSKSESVKKPKGNKKYRNQTRNYKCRKGTFRTASRGHGVYKGVPSKSMHWQYSKAVKNPC